MKSHFHPKTLLFYGTMIGSVLILFRITAAYGEKNLKAPPAVDGRYVSTEAPPGCPDSTRLALTILQSGVYLHGAMHVEEIGAETEAKTTPDKPTLDGRWQNSQIALSGPTNAFATCTAANSEAKGEVNIQGQIASSASDAPATLTGQMTIAGGQPWQFSAERQAAAKKSSDH